MDNNPARRSSESSDEQDTYEFAPEPPDEPDDIRNDAPLCPNVEHHHEKSSESEVSSERNREPPHTKAFHEEVKGKKPLLQLREEDLFVGRTVLKTDLDKLQQTFIQSEVKSPDIDKWKRTANVNSDEVKIMFHVLIPSNVDFQTDKDKVVLCMWEGVNSQNPFIEIEMQMVRYRHDGRNEAQLTGYIILKKDTIAVKSLCYKYCIVRSGVCLETNLPRQATFEYLFSDSNLNVRKLQCIALKDNQVCQGTYHQYDGYIYEPPQGLLQTLSELFQGNKKREDAETATRIFGRDIVQLLLGGQQLPVNIVEATHMSDCLRLCIGKRYKIRDNGVKKTLWRLYTDVLHNLMGIEEDLSIQRKISVCLLMLNIRHFVGYKSGDPANELLCKCFLMKVCKKNRSTVEWDYLKQICIVQDRTSIQINLLELAKDICSDVSNGKNPSWMYLLPVLHFLNGLCRPFQEIPLAFGHADEIPKWWGIDSEIQFLTDSFKKTHCHWCISLRHVVEKLKYMFEVDIYLPRTMMASLRLDELKDALDYDIFPYEIGCASINLFLKTLREYDDSEKALQKCTETLQRHMLTVKNDRFGPRRVLIGLRTSCDLYSESLCRLNSELVLNTAFIFFSFVARFDILQLKSSVLAEELSKVSLNLNVVSAKTFEWINKIQRKHLTMFNLLQIWDQLLRPRGLPNTFHIEEWVQIVITKLKDSMHTALVNDHRGQFKRKLVEAYIAGIDTYSEELHDLLSSFILMALPEQHSENTAVYLKLYDTVSKRFLTEWNGKLNDNKSMNLETIVTWTALPKLIKVLCHESSSNNQNKECQEIIYSVKALVEDFVCVILDGKICVKLLQLMENQKDVLFSLCDVLKFNTEQIRVALVKRREELNAFYRTRATLEALKLFCDGVDEVQVDMEDVEDLLQKNVEESALNELVIVQKLSEEMTHNVQINAKNLNEDVIHMITCLEELKKSGCFTAEWKRVILDLKIHTSLSLNDLYEHVYLPSIESLKEKAKQISSGEIAYVDMEDFVGRICGWNYDTILFELKTFCPDISPKVLSERVEQFKQCRQTRLATKVASVFFKVKDVYGLSGNFSAVDHLKNYDIKTLTLSSKQEDILISSRDLNHVTKEGAACLEAFANCADLISWLRDIIKGGIKEVNVFVDLGMTSAGDDIEKISRVQSLHVAVNGYATLIFELEETSGFKEVLKACDSVFEELQNTPKLPEKLEYAQRYLHWFKEIKQAHSSVEVTSFMQAENINKCGIYQIDTKVWKTFGGQGSQFSLAEFSDIKKVLKLTLSMEGNEGSNPEYTYDKLQDLQSRLMLIAGEAEKSKISVERFNQILEGVVRLCNIYIKLVKSGCMFFQNFAIELVCDTNPNRPIAASLYLANQDSILQCRKTENEQLENIIHRISTTMESCFSTWLEHVDKHRQHYTELNYFTIEQLVILQTEFCKLRKSEEPSKMIYPMLHGIIQNCKPGDIKDAFLSSTSEINEDTGKRTATILNENVAKISPVEEFILDLIDQGYQRMIPLALKQFPELNVNDALIWCMENEDNIEELEDTESLENLTSMVDDMDSQFDRCDNMLIQFEEIWNQFLESIENNSNNFISLKQVGILLRHLAEKDQRKISRSLPRGFSEKSPNLVVCKKENIWSQTLSLYLCDTTQPLPLHDEILTCSEGTSIEQVDIFLRRALFNSCGKIHTIINADKMSFTLCEGIEQRLIKYQRDVHSDYRLVFMCGSDSENKSVLISSLDKYRRTVFLMNKGELSTCLLHKLQNISSSDTVNSAASVDFEKSTVRVVKSRRSGCGKTLYVLRKEEELEQTNQTNVTQRVSLPLHERKVNFNYVTSNLLHYIAEPEELCGKILHIDITNEVQFGIDNLLFNLLILGELVDKSGYVWRKMPTDLYLIETLEQRSSENENERSMLQLLPFVVCRSPKECLDIYRGNYPDDYNEYDQLFDQKLYEKELYQNPYECLKSVDYANDENSKLHCIETMLRHCGVSNPSWSEIHHFVKFLNTQLLYFCNTDFVSKAIEDTLPGFPTFVKKFLIQMSRDFSMRSLNLSEESCENRENEQERNDLRDYEIKRTWESSPYPYLFFNADSHTFTFLGFYINDFGDLVDIHSNKALENHIMNRTLLRALLQNGVLIKEDFDSLQRKDKIERLCGVIGVDKYDPQVYDETYELTTDNCKKMLAVYMRFKCGIPVIIMGETGCGKTRLVTFLCDIMVPRDKDTQEPLTTNMIIMKVHGGITNEDIKSKVWNAERLAFENCETYGENVYTVLFFDEANTTESIGLIKEIMCDNTMEGKPLNICKNLKFVAACNPYRKHQKEVITKLEKAGLGNHVKAIQTKDRFGRIPMRRLVYRVQPLPQSLLPFVWDFGQLSTSVENLYIRHMVRRYMQNGTESTSAQLPNDEQLLEVMSSILTQSQEYMRSLKDECSFVSLRDVDRVLQVMCWFYSMSKSRRTLFQLADEKLRERNQDQKLTDVTRSLLLALAVCYHSSLSQRISYWKYISQFFRMPCEVYGGYLNILEEIDRVQEVFLDSVNLEDNSNIARNHALKENVFMMVVCIELRIPLFLVGKPGSSKSLAKFIVTDAMQGRAAKKPLFKELKQVQMVSFQCSPLSSPEGIISTFHQCARFQQNYKDNLDTFVSVVVLDGIGLAEDSKRMPLKTLHPLLEDGCQGDEIVEQYKKVAFIGISNWSLDPAKMNRGVFVQRQVPELLELENTARGICASTTHMSNLLIKPFSSGYLEVFEKASEEERDFFGLRDFYSLMKMINQIILRSKHSSLPTYIQLRFSVRRNFSGLENIDTFQIFLRNLKQFDRTKERQRGDPDDSFTGLMRSWITNEYSDSRHLLLLTENYSAIALFKQAFLTKIKVQPMVIFASSFRLDQEYTQICRNINKIKICMETGKLVILVNSDNLYESLYDALNQYYVYFGGERYVDLGLGTHRVKCPVHKDFKLIVVAEKQTVYERFPIPLINRLEKHCLISTHLLNAPQKLLAESLKQWVEDVTKQSLALRNNSTENDVAKVFIGYHHDVCATLALKTLTDEMCYENLDHWDKALEKSKDILLWCAAPDAILRLSEEWNYMQDTYWNNQSHESLQEYLSFHFKKRNKDRLHAQITTHSSLLKAAHKHTLTEATGIQPINILILEALQEFDTKQQFISKITGHILKSLNDEPVLIVVQCDSGDRYTHLIACANYAILDECMHLICKAPVSIIFIVQLTPMETKKFHAIQCGDWHSAHIDNLQTTGIEMPSINDMQRNRISVLIAKSIEGRYNLSYDENETPHEQDKFINLRLLIERSLQRVVSFMRDSEDNKHRSTKRVSLILVILQDRSSRDCDYFVRGISVLVQRIMADKENEHLVSSPDMWLSKEAASIVAIKTFGTLRHACIEAFATRMSPILGGLFAVLDTNHNLNLLECGGGRWQRNLLITLLNTKEVGGQMLTKDYTEKGLQFEVYGTGFGGRLFQCKMPFSWIILSTFDAILQLHNILQETTEKGLVEVLEIFGEMELFKAIDSVPKEDFYDVLDSFINDFVQTVYPEEKDRHLVIMSIKQKTLGRITSENTSVSGAFILVHQVYQETKTGLNYYRDISNVWCGCTDAVMACYSNFDDPEINMEFLGLTTLIEHISPKGKADITEWFQSDSNMDNWLEQVQRYRQVVNQTLAFCQDKMTNSALVAKERSRWNRIVVMQLCIENLTSKQSKYFPIDIFPLLWNLLSKEEIDMKCIGPLKEIERFLDACFRTTNCRLVRAVVERIREYRQRCNLVLMDIVSQLCFADNISPNSDVIEWLLSYSFKTVIGEDQQLFKESAYERDIGVDSNNAFKGFLFKYLLRSDGQAFRRHLEQFVNAKDWSQAKNLDDVIFSLIFSIEDNLLETISSNEICKLETIEEYLGDSLHLLEQNETSLDQIYGIAQTRAALTETARCIDLVIKQTLEHESEEMGCFTVVLQRAESLCKQSTLIWKFLLKQIAEEFGTDTLLTACKSSNSLVNWIAMDANEKKTTQNLAKQHLEGSSTTGILAVLYDKQTGENIQENKDDSKISENPLVWIYRKPVSIEHFKQAFQRHLETFPSGETNFTVLSMILKKINVLQALRFVPSILQLNKTLIQRYNRKIYRSEASQISVKQIKEDVFAGEYTQPFEDMVEAWNTVRNALKYHEFTIDKGRTAIPLEWTNMRFTGETELAYFLPSMDGKGICTFALLDFLLQLQNKLMETYISSLSGEMKQVFSVVEPRDITAAHLINFDPEKDLLPIILENCSMSATHIVSDEYDFKAIQKRIIDRFISTKSKVAFNHHFKIDLIVYRSEMTSANQLDILHTKIPQERLDSGGQLALCNEVHDVSSIDQLLFNLDIAIKFLNITGGEPDDSLHEYMHWKLHLKNTKLISKIQQHCLLKHVKSLWMTFSFHRSYLMVRQGKQVQVIFENIESEYHETLQEDIMSVCQSFADSLSMERLTHFLEFLFEFIMLELAKRENKDDEDYSDKSHYRLMSCLMSFGDLTGLDVDVNHIPTSVLRIHSLHMWIVASQILESRLDTSESEI